MIAVINPYTRRQAMEKENENAERDGKPGGNGHEPPWKLDVQGVKIESRQPTIVAREAIKRAGFDPDAAWIIVLKVAGEPKREIDIDTTIDLRHHGLEKLRLTPRQINNGEAQAPRRVDFTLLPVDEAHLNRLGLIWETRNDNGRRWLLMRTYPLPTGYVQRAADIAIEMPTAYPTAQLDMFYCDPHLALGSGAVIPQTQVSETILGTNFQRWSRHRQWDSSRDTLATHLALVDESLRREVE
jgi:hypothetical protein